MALKPIYATEANVLTTELNSLADAGTASTTTEIDNSTNRYLDARIDADIAAAGAATGFVSLYLLEGSATGVLSTTQKPNMRYVGDIQLNGTTDVNKSFFVPNMPKYWKGHIVNNGGAGLKTSGNTVKFTGITYEDV